MSVSLTSNFFANARGLTLADGGGYSPAGYYKDPTGRVFLRGLLGSGASATDVMFTLPSGFQPKYEMIFATVADDAFCELRVNTSGAVGASLAGALGWMARKSVTAQSSQQPFVSFYFTA